MPGSLSAKRSMKSYNSVGIQGGKGKGEKGSSLLTTVLGARGCMCQYGPVLVHSFDH